MKKSYLWSLLAVLLATLMGAGMTSCGHDSDDEKAPSSRITVNGLSETTLQFSGSFDGTSAINFKQTVNVSSTASWSANGVPDWLSVSPLNGSGDLTISIYPKSENDSDAPRTATISLVCSSAVATITVTQEAGKPVCYVTPANLVALYDRICWEYDATNNVNIFQWILLSEREYNRMTDRELLAELDEQEECKYVDEYLSFTSYDSHDIRISENSTYYLVTVAYDERGKAGELKKTKVNTPAYKDADNDAWVSFDNVQCNYSQGFWFDATKEGYCNSYHLIYGILPSEYTYNSVVYAFEINYYLKNRKKHWFADSWDMEIVTNYPNNHTFTYSTSLLSYFPRCFAYGWGVFSNGNISSDLIGFQWDTSEANVKEIKVARSSDAPKNVVIKRSEVTALAKKLHNK